MPPAAVMGRGMDKKQIVDRIAACLGGRDNIVSVTNCMTRLRVVVKADDPVRGAELESIEAVLGVVHDRARSYEVVVGPGNSRTYADICHEMGLPAAAVTAGDWKENKAALRAGQKSNKIKDGLKTLGDIFVPLIPGIIAAGLCAGFASLIVQLVPGYTDIKGWYLAYRILALVNTSFMTYIAAWTGYRAAERFGATPILGGMLGMITSMPGIDEIAQVLGLYDAEIPLNSILKSGKGGVLAVVCGVYVLAFVEKAIRRRMPASADVIFTPFLALVICMVPHVLVIMPLFGFLSNGIAWAFSEACLSESLIVRLLVGYAAAALFLPMVAAGMHHGMVALYTVQLQTLGFVTLYPALCMAGAGQVGAAIAIYEKAKRVRHKKLCSVIAGSLPAGFLGVGEPLIYGVTLPMGRPFLTAGLGAGFGGAFVMAFQAASTTWGPSGLLGVFVMTAGKGGAVKSMAVYLMGLFISYAMSYLITRTAIKDSDVAHALGGVTAEVYENTENSAIAAGVENTALNKNHRRVKHGEPVRLGFDTSVQFEYVIKDPVGIHARPAGELAKFINGLGCDVVFKNGEKTASGKSVIELMMLGADCGSRLKICITGSGAEQSMQQLKKFMEERL